MTTTTAARDNDAATSNAKKTRSSASSAARAPIRPADSNNSARMAKFPAWLSCIIANRRSQFAPPKPSAKSPKPSS